MERTAEFSPCRRYRYALTRKWAEGPQVLFIMFNPSTADETNDDATIRRCISIAKSWEFGSLAVGNLFAFRTSSPAELTKAEDPVGVDNDRWLNALHESARLTVAAWGNHGKFRNRGREVAKRLRKLHYLHLTKQGEPAHPLYAKRGMGPRPWFMFQIDTKSFRERGSKFV
jgi:hypothetical protein